jgi:hypothetical protein
MTGIRLAAPGRLVGSVENAAADRVLDTRRDGWGLQWRG